MTCFKATRLIILMSTSAMVRKDQDLEGCQLRYALPEIMKEELEPRLRDRGLTEYINPDGFIPTEESQIYVPDGGFGQVLYSLANLRNLPSVGLIRFTYEGDNEAEGLSVAETVMAILGQEITEWKKPMSWRLLYGNAPPKGMY